MVVIETLPTITDFLPEAKAELATCRKPDGSLNEEVVTFLIASLLNLRAMDKRHIKMIETISLGEVGF